MKGRYKTVQQGHRVASSEVGFGAGSPLVQVEVTLDEIQNGRPKTHSLVWNQQGKLQGAWRNGDRRGDAQPLRNGD